MGIVQQIPGLCDRREGQSDGVELCRQLHFRIFPEDLGESRQQPGTLPYTVAVGAQPRVRREVLNKLTTGLKNPRP